MAARTGPHPPVECSTPGCAVLLTYNPRRKGTRCRACLEAALRLPERACTECGKAIERRTDRATTTLCVVHAAKSESRCVKLRASMKVVHADPEFQRRRGRAITAVQLKHIPLEYREDYLDLLHTTGATKAERTAAIRNQMEVDARNFHRTGQLPQTTRNRK